jgi:predicted phage terminase large subunit-like protein
MSSKDIEVRPQSPFQEKYLKSNAKILIVGGAAGSSKSYVGLMRHLRWTNDPNYRGFCIRKNSTAIMKSGGLFEQAKRLYSKVYPPINGVPQIQTKLKDQKLVFPSGASISFSHYENDSAGDLYQGLELSSVFYDEGTHADESHLWWLFSRLRTEADMGYDENGKKLEACMWVSCNPDPDSFLYEWVKWWLYPEGHEKFGLPDPEKNGLTRYLLRVEGELVWGDTWEELYEKHHKPEFPVDHEEQIRPIPFQVLLGNLYDNPTLMKSNPGYKAALEALPDVERRRLLLGDWNAREVGSTYFQREWCKELLEEPPKSDIVRTVRAYDFAGTLKSSANPSPDYTASAKISKLKNGDYFVHDVQRTRMLFGEWESHIIANARRDGGDCEIIVPLDPGAQAKVATGIMTRSLSEKGYRVRTIKTSQSKLDRFRPFSSLAHNGHISFLKGCGYDYENNIEANNNFVFKELEAFNGKRKGGEAGHDDIVDACSDCISILATRVNIPNMANALGSMKLTNPTSF